MGEERPQFALLVKAPIEDRAIVQLCVPTDR